MFLLALPLSALVGITAAQVTLTNSICRGPECLNSDGCPVAEVSTETTTEYSTVYEGQISTSIVTELSTTTEELTVTSTATQEVTVTSTTERVVEKTHTVTHTITEGLTTRPPQGGPQPACPTLTSTGTACGSCPIPGCNTRVRVTQGCGCPQALPTTTVDFRCGDEDVCNRIGCTTAYDVVTAEGC